MSNPQTTLLGNYAPAWRERYASANYLNVDPTVAHALTSTRPLVWTDDVFAHAGAFWEDARGHGLRVGWAQPAHDLKGKASLLTLARSDDAMSPLELGDKAPLARRARPRSS